MHSRRFLFSAAAVVLAVASQPAAAQRSETYISRLKDAEARIAALPASAWDTTRSPEKNAALRPFIPALETLGMERAFAGDTAGAIAAYDAKDRTRSTRPVANPAEATIVDEASVEDALQAIVEQARTRRVVLINEGHNVPMHRAFSQRLARELRKIGCTYLACETFDALHPKAFSEGYARQKGGYYTRDPVFGGWIAEAIADGWQLVAYESLGSDAALTPEQRIVARETLQASNLVERIFANDKNAKVLIHVGYGHLDKGSATLPSGTDLVMMGEHLRRMTGLDMLHVDQNRFYAHPDPADDNPLYARALARTTATAPFVLKAKDGSYAVLLDQKGRVDMQVVFPRYAFHDQNGRPEWLATLAGRRPRALPPELLPVSGRRAVLAYRAGEPADAVPADVVLVEAGKPAPKLMLPDGEYRFAVEE
ncbi:hypothetical protein [Massilia sp. TWR1-2-2]|uniref:hypothetical protein n=1 Tax=Massilia sp. TWR1-2-2 TaxID=2804584 RepID=UPI003CF69146